MKITYKLKNLPTNKISPRNSQIRIKFYKEDITRTANSIEEKGFINPVEVEPIEGGLYKLVTGEIRWRAAKKLALPEIPCKVLDQKLPEDERYSRQFHENIIRGELSPWAIGKGLERERDILVPEIYSGQKTKPFTQGVEALSNKFQMSISKVSNYLTLVREKDKRIIKASKKRGFKLELLTLVKAMPEEYQDKLIDFITKQPTIKTHGFRRILQAIRQAPHLIDKFLAADYTGMGEFEVYRKVSKIYPEFVEIIEDEGERMTHLSEDLRKILAVLNYYPLAAYSPRGASWLTGQLELVIKNMIRFRQDEPVRIPKQLTTKE